MRRIRRKGTCYSFFYKTFQNIFYPKNLESCILNIKAIIESHKNDDSFSIYLLTFFSFQVHQAGKYDMSRWDPLKETMHVFIYLCIYSTSILTIYNIIISQDIPIPTLSNPVKRQPWEVPTVYLRSYINMGAGQIFFRKSRCCNRFFNTVELILDLTRNFDLSLSDVLRC